MKADGIILIDTKVRTDGFEEGFQKIKNEMGGVTQSAASAAQNVQAAFSNIDVSNFTSAAAVRVKQLEQQIWDLDRAIDEAMQNGDSNQGEKLFAKSESLYNQLELARARLASEVAKSAEREARAEQKAAEKKARAKQKEVRDAQKAEKQKQRAEEKRYRAATKSVRHFGSRFKEIVSGALVFNLISAGLRNVTQYFGKALNSNDEYKKSLASLKGALLTAFQPIYEVAVPAIIALLNIATKAAQAIGHIFASLAGKSDAQMAKNAKALYEQANAIDETGKSAKKAQRYLAGFDQIQKVSKNTGEEESATAPDFSAFESADYQSKIEGLVMLTSMALLSLGAILAFSGANIPLGIGMMALGAAGMYSAITENWGAAKQALQGPIGDVLMLLGTALLAIGAILAFSGANIPLGIGFIVAGAATLAPTIAANWNTIGDKLKILLANLLAIISGAALVIGFVLLLSGAGIGLGLALIAAGIAGSVTAWNLNDNPITRFVKNMVNGIIAVVNLVIDAINTLFHIKFKGLNIGGVQLIPEINTKLLNIPKIPMLAEGAVIPPNRKFMAMLGDQRHGTNIEAPLETIQEAVAAVMADFHAGNMAGHEATVAVLKEILEAVLGIEIGDSVIGEAYERYRRKMAIAKGGV